MQIVLFRHVIIIETCAIYVFSTIIFYGVFYMT